jgi:hypothetical protein
VVLATPSVLSLLPRRDLEGLLDRHAGGDWAMLAGRARGPTIMRWGTTGGCSAPTRRQRGGSGSSPRWTAPPPLSSCRGALRGCAARAAAPRPPPSRPSGGGPGSARSCCAIPAGSDEGRVVDRPRPGHGPRRLPGVLRMVLLGGAGQRHPRRQAGRPVRHLPRVQKASSGLAHRCGERHIREGRQMYPNTGGKTMTTIAAHTA